MGRLVQSPPAVRVLRRHPTLSRPRTSTTLNTSPSTSWSPQTSKSPDTPGRFSGEPPDRTHTRVRTDKINNGKITLRHAGQLYSIGLGQHHNGQTVLMLVHDLDITISNATTGQILRQLTLNPTTATNPKTADSPNPEGSGSPP